jgi:transcriptional regulator with GAF, ATPase, and Fis domain
MEIKSLKSKEKELLEAVLEKTHWNLEKSSRLLKISVLQIKRKIKAYDIKKTQNP